MIMMYENVQKHLLRLKRKTISIDELAELSPLKQSYEQFAAQILELERENILQMVKARGRNNRTPELANHYRINKYELNRTYHKELQAYRLQFHHAIDLDAYFKLTPNEWMEDLPFLEKINHYLETYGLPTEKAPAPERSFELVGDEKWIEEKGSELLQRINLWEAMQIFPVSDPLMFAIHPLRTSEQQHFHLIVENKTTYQALLPVLQRTIFSTLIYGVGNKIVKSIENFTNQYPVSGTHIFFYFGDLDQSGITIWHGLNEREQAIPALPFYEACLTKEVAYGKTNQRPNEMALTKFLTFFSKNAQQKIESILSEGAYYPQEVLKTAELQEIWLNTDWQRISEEINDTYGKKAE